MHSGDPVSPLHAGGGPPARDPLDGGSSPSRRGDAAARRWRFLAGLALVFLSGLALFHALLSRAPGAAAGSPGVLLWWSALSAVGVTNLVAWAVVARIFHRERATLPAHIAAQRRWQIVLCGLYVAGCALRSFFPKADVQRICLIDSLWSSVLVGRSVATIAEISFVAQWTLLLSEYAREIRSRFALIVARLALPLIVFAEIWSWYAVLTTSYLGNVVEQSTWTTTAALIVVGGVSVYRRSHPCNHRFLAIAMGMGAAFVLFMVTVDVPMYVGRFLEDHASGRAYLPLVEGLHDLATRWIVTFRWEEWSREIPWMSLYFSVEVWLSIAFIRAPCITTATKGPYGGP